MIVLGHGGCPRIQFRQARLTVMSVAWEQTENAIAGVSDLLDRVATEGCLLLSPELHVLAKPVREALSAVPAAAQAGSRPPVRIGSEDAADALARLAGPADPLLADAGPSGGGHPAELLEMAARWACARRFATPDIPAERLHVSLRASTERQALRAVLDGVCRGERPVLDIATRLDGRGPAGDLVIRPGDDVLRADCGGVEYQRVEELVREHRPEVLIAGGDGSPRMPDWRRLGEIREGVGDCLLVAELGQAAGLVMAGECPGPVGLADAVTFTTHGTLCGPSGAGIVTAHHDLARAAGRSLRRQAPDAGRLAAMAEAFAWADSKQFRRLQARIASCARRLCGELEAAQGTDTHLCVIEAAALAAESGETMVAEALARILVAAGIIAGFRDDRDGGALMLDATWLAHVDATDEDAARVGECVAAALSAARPAASPTMPKGPAEARIAIDALAGIRPQVRDIAEGLAGAAAPSREAAAPEELAQAVQEHPLFACGEVGLLAVQGIGASMFLDQAATGRVGDLSPGESAHTLLLAPDGTLIDDVVVRRSSETPSRWLLYTHLQRHSRVGAWLRGLSAGAALCDVEDPHRSLAGPVTVHDLGAVRQNRSGEPGPVSADARREAGLPIFDGEAEAPDGLTLFRGACAELFALEKPWFVGQAHIEEAAKLEPRPRRFEPAEETEEELRETPLIAEHERLDARLIEFAGWRMPGWYTSVAAEHAAVREAAGLFDLGHMGVVELSGERVADFLEAVTTGRMQRLRRGECHYTYLLTPDGLPLDDIILYRRAEDCFLAVVNAANASRVLDWLTGVTAGEYVITEAAPHRRAPGRVQVRDLTARSAGDDRLMVMALQGLASGEVLCDLTDAPRAACAALTLGRFEFLEARLGDIPAFVSRTGYTGEAIGYELMVHPSHAAALWRRLLEVGDDRGVMPAGLGARDSLRIEAGLPLYGHELAGPHEITPPGAGYSRFVSAEKPFFVGRDALLRREADRSQQIVRFRVDEEGVRAIRSGDPVASSRGECVGHVTSCAPVEGRQVGMAWVDRRVAVEGSGLLLFPARQLQRSAPAREAGELSPGDRMPIHVHATVVRRFPR